jgi:RimJ/RimL family protein N-acetyltransferase
MSELVLTTERLSLRPWRVTDTAHYLTLSRDIGYHAFSLPGSFLVSSPAEAESLLARKREQFEASGLGMLAVFQEGTTFLGTCGLERFSLEGEEVIEIGCRLLLRHWGKGYATEASRAVLRHGLETLGLRRIVSFVLPQNHASSAVMEKIGLRLAGGCTLADEPHCIYEITRV